MSTTSTDTHTWEVKFNYAIDSESKRREVHDWLTREVPSTLIRQYTTITPENRPLTTAIGTPRLLKGLPHTRTSGPRSTDKTPLHLNPIPVDNADITISNTFDFALDAFFILPRRTSIGKIIAKIYGTPKNKLLLYGPPGTGKTVMAKALARKLENELSTNDTKVKFFMPPQSMFQSSYVSETARNIERIYDQAIDQVGPTGIAVIFLDEFETLVASRSTDKQGNNNTIQSLLQLWDNGNDKYTHNIITIAATNMYDSIDRAIMRRFDTQFLVDLPTGDTMKKLISKNLKDIIRGEAKNRAEYNTFIETAADAITNWCKAKRDTSNGRMRSLKRYDSEKGLTEVGLTLSDIARLFQDYRNYLFGLILKQPGDIVHHISNLRDTKTNKLLHPYFQRKVMNYHQKNETDWKRLHDPKPWDTCEEECRRLIRERLQLYRHYKTWEYGSSYFMSGFRELIEINGASLTLAEYEQYLPRKVREQHKNNQR